MRVFLYAPFYPPQSQAAATRCYWLNQILKDAGHIVLVASAIETSETYKLTFNQANNKQNLIKRLFFEIISGIELFFRIFQTHHDLYILSSPPFITVSIAHLACRIRGFRYVIDVRDIYPDVYFAQGLIKESSVFGKIAKVFTKTMYSHAIGITSVTPGLIEKIKTLAPQATTELLINGYDKDLFKSSEVKFETFTVIFHGNMGRFQNLLVILKVAKALENENIDFLFIGEGPQANIFMGNIPKNVKYLGPRKYQEIPDIISKAHVGFSARVDDKIGSDAFPVKVFEYLGVGIPVIITPRSDLMTKMVEYGIYEFNNDQIDEIVKKILEIKNLGGAIKLKEEMSRQEVSKKILKFLQP